MLIAGFTGTQNGMTPKQEFMLTGLLVLRRITTLHHGDCIGSDAQAHNIVQEVEVLFAAPAQAEEQTRSGTWATVRYARQARLPHIIILPSGEAAYALGA